MTRGEVIAAREEEKNQRRRGPRLLLPVVCGQGR
jgi:hypothetical protein